MRVFKGRQIRAHMAADDLDDLVSDFKRYKLENNDVPETFGRDVRYHRPPLLVIEEVSHLHLGDFDTDPHIRQYDKTSDTHIVYCPAGVAVDTFALLAILTPNAHEQARDPVIMHNIGKSAERFRQRH